MAKKFTDQPKILMQKVLKELLDLDDDQYYTVEIKAIKSKRSLEQNRMLWKNIDLASKALGMSIWDVYANLLIEANVESNYLYVDRDMEDYLRKSFRAVQFVQITKLNGKDAWVYRVFEGSSKMTIKQCTELLDRSLDLLTKLGENYKDSEEIR